MDVEEGTDMSRPSNEVINRSRRKIYKIQTINFHREKDADCIAWLDRQESKPESVKRLIRQDIAREGGGEPRN